MAWIFYLMKMNLWYMIIELVLIYTQGLCRFWFSLFLLDSGSVYLYSSQLLSKMFGPCCKCISHMTWYRHLRLDWSFSISIVRDALQLLYIFIRTIIINMYMIFLACFLYMDQHSCYYSDFSFRGAGRTLLSERKKLYHVCLKYVSFFFFVFDKPRDRLDIREKHKHPN